MKPTPQPLAACIPFASPAPAIHPLPPSLALHCPPSRRTALLIAIASALTPPRTARADPPFTAPSPTSFARATDEFDVRLSTVQPLGLRLKDLSVGASLSVRQGTSRVVIADVFPDGQAAAAGNIDIDQIVVAVNGENVERDTAEAVAKRLKADAGGREVVLTLKDPSRFYNRLVDAPYAGEAEVVESTALTPSGPDAPAQILTVRRRSVPADCRRPASTGDLLEIAYEGRLAADGTLFDGMQLAKRQADASLQFVLGKQPVGQFPPAWDVSLEGMCIGEVRTISVPPVLGYGAKGLPKRGIPPNAQLVYEVELIAINANTSP